MQYVEGLNGETARHSRVSCRNRIRVRSCNPTSRGFLARAWGSEQTSPKERGPIEGPLRWNRETDRVCEGISEGCRSAEPERVAPGGAGAVEPQPRADESKLKSGAKDRESFLIARRNAIPTVPVSRRAAADSFSWLTVSCSVGYHDDQNCGHDGL